MNQMHLHTSGDLGTLARAFVSASAGQGDPFARPLVLVPGPGVQRWLSQQFARAASSDGEGICAGLDMQPLRSLERSLTGDRIDDPWTPERLVWAVLAAVDTGAPGLELLAAHLSANDQRYANALRVAKLLGRYADHRPDMLSRWSAEPATAAKALGIDGWQVNLWVALQAGVMGVDPVVRRARLTEAVASGALDVPWPSIHVFAPRHSTTVQRVLLHTLARRIPVHIWLATSGPDGDNALAHALGRASRDALAQWRQLDAQEATLAARRHHDTTLGRLQASLLSGEPLPDPIADGSVRVVSSHAMGRQVEVLREILTGLFADDPTLEPRDVVIAAPNPTELAPHLVAAFTDPSASTPRAWRHPATELRLQVVETDASASNQLYALLRDLMTLGASRATASQLLALAAHPFVARRFRLGSDDLERLEELVSASAIRWGINPEHRARFGLGDVHQNTWQLGVQRLVLGEAFSDDRLASVGVVATVDDVSSTDSILIGALAELVSRLTRLVRALSGDGSAADWVMRLRQAIELLADVPFEDSWQLSQAWSVLEAIERRSAQSGSLLAPADALALLAEGFSERAVRPAFGSGAMVVCSLDALARVPHRVVCLVGLDERSFPRRGLGDGDDLLVRDPNIGDPDPGSDDRQSILDAVLAAEDRLVVVYQGQSSLTPEPHHPPAGVQEIIEAVGGSDAVEHASLHDFAWQQFTKRPTSFDVTSRALARWYRRESPPPTAGRSAISTGPRR